MSSMRPGAASGPGPGPSSSSSTNLAKAATTGNGMPPPPPLLLTKRVTAFLHANLSPHVRTAAMTTPSGKLLAHASTSLPASALRRQCAVAASLWALHAPPSLVNGGGGGENGGQGGYQEAASAAVVGQHRAKRGGRKGEAPAVTVQLDSGLVFVIRRLRCGMLFVCMGGTEEHHHKQTSGGEVGGAQQNHESEDTRPHDHSQQQQTSSDSGTAAIIPPPESSNTTQTHLHPSSATGTTTPGGGGQQHQSSPLGSPSEAASVLSTGTAGGASQHSTSTAATGTGGGLSTPGVMAMRRHVEELARWLDERLGSLYVPEEGIGISTQPFPPAGTALEYR